MSAVTSWHYPTVAAGSLADDDNANAAWVNPSYIFSDNTAYASRTVSSSSHTRTLRGSGFGFTSSDIPDGSTITGIELAIRRYSSPGLDYLVSLVPQSTGSIGDRAGDNKADTVTVWPNSPADALYGGDGDMWGTTISLSQIRSSDFAVDFMGTASSLSATLAIDSFRGRIYFIPPPAQLSATITEAGDILQATGLINQPRAYSASIVEAADTAAATGTVKVKGAAALTEAADSLYARIGYTAVIDWDFTASESPDPRLVFSGEVNATRVNSAGQIVAASAPRYDYDPVTLEAKGLLIEESRTNLLLRSSEFDVTWSQVGGSITANADIGPDGALSADLFVEGATTTAYGVDQAVTVTAGVQTLSYFVKYAGRRWIRIAPYGAASPGNCSVWFDILNGVMGVQQPNCTGTITPAGNGWYRITWTATTTAGTLTTALRSATGDNLTGNPAGLNGPAYYLWGAQLEAGGSATSNILTGAAQVTRSAPSLTVSGASFSGFFNPSGGTIVVDFDRLAPIDSTDRMVVEVDDGTTTNRLDMYVRQAGRAFGRASSVTAFDFANLGAMASGAPQRMALAFADNDFAASMNGSEPSTDTSGAVPAVNQMLIGMGHVGSPLNGHIRRLRYYDVRVKDSELKALTALQGRAVIVEAGDTLAADAKAYIKAAVNKIEATDALTATAQVYVKAVLNKIEATDALSSAATVRIKGALARTEAGDTLSATAKALIRATVTIGEAGDTLAATADAGPTAVASERRTIILLGAPLSGRTVALTGSRLADRTITI